MGTRTQSVHRTCCATCRDRHICNTTGLPFRGDGLRSIGAGIGPGLLLLLLLPLLLLLMLLLPGRAAAVGLSLRHNEATPPINRKRPPRAPAARMPAATGVRAHHELREEGLHKAGGSTAQSRVGEKYAANLRLPFLSRRPLRGVARAAQAPE